MKRLFILATVLMLTVTFIAPVMAQRPGTISTSFVRPANATAYAPGDVIRTSTGYAVPVFIPANSTNFPSKTGEILSCIASDDTAGTKYISVYVLSDTTGYSLNIPDDNAAFVMTSTFAKKVLGKFTLTLNSRGTGGVGYADTTFRPIPFNLTGWKGIYLLPVAEAAFTPKNAGTFTFRLGFKFY